MTTNIGAALSELADLNVQARRGDIASVFLRGAHRNFSAILLEGAPLNNPTHTRDSSSTRRSTTITASKIAVPLATTVY